MALSIGPVSPIFPIASLHLSTAWTTSTAPLFAPIERVHLDDDRALGVHNVFARTTHAVVAPPAPLATNGSDASAGAPEPLWTLDPPAAAWEAVYPAGSVNPSNATAGGFGFYLDGPETFTGALREADEVLMSYAVMFGEDWDWVKGGKLPGMYGGLGDSAYGCTGGRKENRTDCFNLRLMWRTGGAGELYAYVPPHPANAARLAEVPPWSRQNADYGFSVGRGAFRFARGKWTAVAQRVRLNTPGHENGEIQVWIDGRSVIDVAGLVLRESGEAGVRGMHFQTFFGGHTEDWASPKDQRAWFADVSGAIVTGDRRLP